MGHHEATVRMEKAMGFHSSEMGDTAFTNCCLGDSLVAVLWQTGKRKCHFKKKEKKCTDMTSQPVFARRHVGEFQTKSKHVLKSGETKIKLFGCRENVVVKHSQEVGYRF